MSYQLRCRPSPSIVVLLVSLFLVSNNVGVVDSAPFSFWPIEDKESPDDDLLSHFIFGGDDTEPGEYPYFAEMEQCGGVLVAPDIVLTVAHCGSLTNQQVNIGSHRRRSSSGGAQQRYCDRWIRHPDYNTGTGSLDHDFALCKLDRPVEVSDRQLAKLNGDGEVPAIENELLAIGYGYMNVENEIPEILQDVTVLSISDADCENTWNSVNKTHFVPEIQMCAGYLGLGEKDSCVGDSGGPLIRRTLNISDGEYIDTLVGIVSFGTLPCGQAEYPAVYARISFAYDWIITEMCTTFQSISSICGENLSGGEPLPYTPRPCEPTESEMVVQMKTDPYPIESAVRSNYWTLHEGTASDPIVKYRRYFLTDFENEPYKLCLKGNQLYTWRLIDRKWNGMCTNGVCGSYKVTVNGRTIAEGDGDDFVNKVEQSFTTVVTEAPTTSPTALPSFSPTAPTSLPSFSPSVVPTMGPSVVPSDSKVSKKTKRRKRRKRRKGN